MVEAAYRSGQETLTVTHGVFAKAGTLGYVLNFTNMTQTHVANQISRPIKRMVRQ